LAASVADTQAEQPPRKRWHRIDSRREELNITIELA
jgi:hypothetical protein